MPEPTQAVVGFGARLGRIVVERGRVCLGIDPHPFLLAEWDLPDTAEGVRDFGLRAVDAAAGATGIVKPQVAFFERHGSAGYAALESVLSAARGAGLLVIADAKRGDVGSTVAAYGAAWLTPGSALEADALTVSAYQGVGSLSDVVRLAAAAGKGIFVLAATSNPESAEVQSAVRDRGRFGGMTVAASIVSEVDQLNSVSADAAASGGAAVGEGAPGHTLGGVGVVLGATVSLSDYGIETAHLARTPILAPGFGEQGAKLSDLVGLYGPVAGNVIANVGRSVLRSGASGLRESLTRAAGELNDAEAR